MSDYDLAVSDRKFSGNFAPLTAFCCPRDPLVLECVSLGYLRSQFKEQ